MIRVAARPPNQNAELIQNNGLNSLGFLQQGGVLQQFNLGIATQMTVVPGRVLPPPQILYGGNKTMRADNASWNLRDIKFQVGARLERWAVLNLREKGSKVRLFEVQCPYSTTDQRSWLTFRRISTPALS
jgi:eukaryotic translation initiation factor 2C